jgi:SAM-dependent methyltransferase
LLKAQQSPSYQAIGQFYDAFYGDTPAAWASARRRLLKPALLNARRVCEVGCGTGQSAIEFARLGLKVFALDYSSEMCRITREKALAEGLDVNVARADMRKFRLRERVDLVTSEWGVINHLRKRSELAGTFRAVARALKPGGYFYFDLHQRRVYEIDWSNTFMGDGTTADGKDFFGIQHGGFDRSSGKGWVDVTIFARAGGGLWRRHGERINEIYWPHSEIVRDLKRAGFELLRLFDFVKIDLPPKSTKILEGARTMYLARYLGS